MKAFFSALLLLLAGHQVFAQAAGDTAPYRKYPSLPAFYILLPDSSAAINTFDIPEGNTTVLLMFSPDCHHCRELVPQLLQKVDSFKDVRFYFITLMGLKPLREFITEFKLATHDNILTGKDYNFFYPSFFKIKYVPHAAVYDRHKKLVDVVDGNFKADQLLDVIRAAEKRK